jgi:hypothetical protein
MLGYDFVVLAFACCGWLPTPMEIVLSPRQQEAVSDAALMRMKGRKVTVDTGYEFSEAGMRDPAGEIAGSLASSLAGRYGLEFEPGRQPDPDGLVLGVHTLEWLVEPGWKDYKLRYRGEATLVDRRDGRRLGRARCDRDVTTGKNSYDAAIADRPALASALHAAAGSCLLQLREALLVEATPL